MTKKRIPNSLSVKSGFGGGFLAFLDFDSATLSDSHIDSEESQK